MEPVEKKSSVVPETVMEALRRTQNNIGELNEHFTASLPLFDADILASMPPLERAQSLLLLAKASTTLFILKLRCNGINPDDHPVKSELERLRLYQEKLDRCIDLSRAPLRPSATLNYQAATRFIDHSLPDLTPEQKRSMRSISRGEGAKILHPEKNVNKRRKFQSSEKQSVQIAAQEFLEKAAREILGDNKGGLRGPLQPECLEEDEMPID